MTARGEDDGARGMTARGVTAAEGARATVGEAAGVGMTAAGVEMAAWRA